MGLAGFDLPFRRPGLRERGQGPRVYRRPRAPSPHFHFFPPARRPNPPLPTTPPLCALPAARPPAPTCHPHADRGSAQRRGRAGGCCPSASTALLGWGCANGGNAGAAGACAVAISCDVPADPRGQGTALRIPSAGERGLWGLSPREGCPAPPRSGPEQEGGDR